MKNEIIISGFGGQGTLLAGALIAQSAVEQDLETTWFPSYGAEIRGGTANSTVIVSDDEIGSPVVFHPNALIALNEQSLDKFVPNLMEDAIIIAPYENRFNGKFNYYFVETTKIAEDETKSSKTANMVAVGALLAALENRVQNKEPFLTCDSAFKACQKAFAQKPQFIELNKKAILAGYNFIKERK
ncbi:MAG: 2-oxoacid:acceptor oxidoreductase family protein [Elusimicrobiota bacterium]|jgi:2-oxoglutarate ferredoxin oxidoreductase subunit gamma|nr:2-oxoacid:acceptor oxidoreductase family protein [Elusimicrobiota bacterium]